MQLDHPNVRKSCTCPLCHGVKDEGLVACWSCYRSAGLRYGNPAAERMIAKADELLAEGFEPLPVRA